MKIRKKMGLRPKTSNGKILVKIHKASPLAAALRASVSSNPNVLLRRSGQQSFKFNAPTIRLTKTAIRTFGVNAIMRKRRNSTSLEIPLAEFKNEAAYSFFMLKWA